MPAADIIRERLAEHFHRIKVDELMEWAGNWVSVLFPAHTFGLLDPKRNARLDRVPGGFCITYGKLRELRAMEPSMPANEFPSLPLTNKKFFGSMAHDETCG
jgi:hypothetical protein